MSGHVFIIKMSTMQIRFELFFYGKNFKFILREKLASNYIKSIWTLKCKIMNFNSCGEKTPELQIATILIKWNSNERCNGEGNFGVMWFLDRATDRQKWNSVMIFIKLRVYGFRNIKFSFLFLNTGSLYGLQMIVWRLNFMNFDLFTWFKNEITQKRVQKFIWVFQILRRSETHELKATSYFFSTDMKWSFLEYMHVH